MTNRQHYRSNGKLLITGEYFVLEGALAFAVPTQKGQHLYVGDAEKRMDGLQWKSYDCNHKLWLSVVFRLPDFEVAELACGAPAAAQRLQGIFRELSAQRPGFADGLAGLEAVSQVEFPQNWGLGSSSTLIANLAKWADANPYLLLEKTFGGSGYDLACAVTDQPLHFRLTGDLAAPFVEKVPFDPPFADSVYFVHLGKKQNSRQGISHFYQMGGLKNHQAASEISEISQQIAICRQLGEFERLLARHEKIVSNALRLERVQDSLFSDLPGIGVAKSLGAWGGDFALLTSHGKEGDLLRNLRRRGFETVLGYRQMCLLQPHLANGGDN